MSILVFIEHKAGALNKTSLEAIAAAQKLGADLSQKPEDRSLCHSRHAGGGADGATFDESGDRLSFLRHWEVVRTPLYDTALAYQAQKWGTAHLFLDFLTLDQRALAAWDATALRRAAVIVSSRRLPPI